MQDRPSQHHRSDLDQLEFEGRDDAEVATAAAHAPEEVGVLDRAGPNLLAIRGDQLDGPQVVDRQAELAHQPAGSAAKGESRDTGMRNLTRGYGQPMRLGGGIELSEQDT